MEEALLRASLTYQRMLDAAPAPGFAGRGRTTHPAHPVSHPRTTRKSISMMTLLRPRWPLVLIPFLMLGPATAAIGSAAPARTAALVKIATIRMLTTPTGMTLYMFTADKPNQINCSGGCATFWPPFLAHGRVTATVAHIKGAFGVATRAGGLKQITFNGAPLYTFSGDKKPGDINGQGIALKWWVVPAPGTGRITTPASVGTAPLRMLVTARGLAIYLLATDKPGHAGCTGACAKFWPPVLITGAGTAPTTQPGIAGAFGTTQGAGSTRQLTFNGTPLYTFAKDMKPGDMNGEGVAHVWWIVVPPAHVTAAPQTLSPTSMPSSSPTVPTQPTATSTTGGADVPTAVPSSTPTSTTQAMPTATATVYSRY